MHAIAAKVIPVLGDVVVTKADFSKLVVKMASLHTNENGPKPRFDNIEVIDFGNAIRFGQYEASMRSLLYQNDHEYRLEQKKQRLVTERSFGACLRRYRLLKSMDQTDFSSVSEKTIRRIEEGCDPKESTKDKILNELGVKLDDLLSY